MLFIFQQTIIIFDFFTVQSKEKFFLYLKIKMDKPNELDFSSSEFNALEALLSPDVTVPVPEAPMYDNLGQFVSTLNRARAKQAQGDVRFHLVV